MTMAAFSRAARTREQLWPRMARVLRLAALCQKRRRHYRTAKKSCEQTADTHLRTTLECMKTPRENVKGQPAPANVKVDA